MTTNNERNEANDNLIKQSYTSEFCLIFQVLCINGEPIKALISTLRTGAISLSVKHGFMESIKTVHENVFYLYADTLCRFGLRLYLRF